jgi:hypothetical protein
MKHLFLRLLFGALAVWAFGAGVNMLFGTLGSLLLSVTYIVVLILLPALSFGLSYSLVLTLNIRSIAGVVGMILVLWHLCDFFGHMLTNLPFLADFWAGVIAGAMQTTALWGILTAARENWKAGS